MSLLLLILAAICNAVMDTLADEPHYDRSIFKNKDKQFWLKTQSHTNKHKPWIHPFGIVINKPAQISDAWHIAKTIMIFAICFSIVLFPMMRPICLFETQFLNSLLYVLVMGLAWNNTFSLFFKYILTVRSWEYFT